MPVLPSCITEPLWDQFAALLPDRVDPHPLGCHRRRIPDRTVFEHILAALVHGSGTSASPAPGCSDRTTRHRVKAWAKLGDRSRGPCLALAAYDRMIGLGWTSCRWTAASPRHPAAGSGRAPPRSPVDRGKQGTNARSPPTRAAFRLGSLPPGQPARLTAARPHPAGRDPTGRRPAQAGQRPPRPRLRQRRDPRAAGWWSALTRGRTTMASYGAAPKSTAWS
jgi:hypothetical protein